VGTLYRVEKYLVVQKMTRLKTDLYLESSTTLKTYMLFK